MSTFVVNGTAVGSAGDTGAGVTTRPSAPTDRLTSDWLIFHVVFRQPRTSSTAWAGMVTARLAARTSATRTKRFIGTSWDPSHLRTSGALGRAPEIRVYAPPGLVRPSSFPIETC